MSGLVKATLIRPTLTSIKQLFSVRKMLGLSNSMARFLAICPTEKYRDGKRAIDFATKACEFTNWKDGDFLDTLAAAYAEAGEFEKAVKWQLEAVDLAAKDDKADRESSQSRIFYKSGKPFSGRTMTIA